MVPPYGWASAYRSVMRPGRTGDLPTGAISIYRSDAPIELTRRSSCYSPRNSVAVAIEELKTGLAALREKDVDDLWHAVLD